MVSEIGKRRKKDAPRYRTESRHEDDEETSFPHDMRHASVIQVVSLITLGPGAAPVFEREEVANLTKLSVPRLGGKPWTAARR